MARRLAATDRTQGGYVPALGWRWLTPLYDPLISRLMPETAIKGRLVDGARVAPGHRLLDVGCGTGTLAILAKQRQPEARIVGLAADPDILRIARTKARRAGADVSFDRGTATALPYPEASFDRVFTTLALHHLKTEDKRRACREMFRVLRPGGQLHVADYGPPHTRLMQVISLVVRHFEDIGDNVKGMLPTMFREAGFGEVRQASRFATAGGTLALYSAVKPAIPREQAAYARS